MDESRATELHVLSDVVNNVVVRTEGRRLPALVVQGDRLHEWLRLAKIGDEDSLELLYYELQLSVVGFDRVCVREDYEHPHGGAWDRPDFDLLSSKWTDVRGTSEQAEFEAELTRELSPGHLLAGLDLSAVAARKLRKEVVFHLSDGRWAWVHLTWHEKSHPSFPSTVICDSWPELVEELIEASRE